MIVAEVVHQHTSQDLVFVAVSVGLAVVGSFASLVSAIRIPLSRGAAKVRWTVAAAVSLGGGAIWSMHFIGMMGYHVDGVDLRYDLPRTGLSLLIAISVSALGLTLVARRPHSAFWLATSGVIAGLGVAAMHYTGMAAMQTGGTVTYRRDPVIISVVIAVIAALAALWIAFRVRTGWHVLVASVVMAVAVCGMHYTAMSATRVQAGPPGLTVPGTDPISLGLLVCVLAFSVLAVVIFTALGGVTDVGVFSLAREGSRHRRLPGALEPAGPAAVPARPRAGDSAPSGSGGEWNRAEQLRARAERPASPPHAFRPRDPSTAGNPEQWAPPPGTAEFGTAEFGTVEFGTSEFGTSEPRMESGTEDRVPAGRAPGGGGPEAPVTEYPHVALPSRRPASGEGPAHDSGAQEPPGRPGPGHYFSGRTP